MVSRSPKKTSTEIPTTPTTPINQTQEPNIAVERDEFCDPSYLDPSGKLPRIQAVRGTSPSLCGYFVSIEQLAKAGWLDYSTIEDKIVTYTFEMSQKEESGLLLPSPRMLVCAKSPLLAFDRDASKKEEQTVLLGTYQKEYKGLERVGNLQYYEIVLLDENNRPLHQVPFAYAAKGANGASFSIHWQEFIEQITTCHAIANGIAARPKDARFKALCVFVPVTKRELVGDKQKSWACRIVEHEVPTLENWLNYFLGRNQTLKAAVWEQLQPQQPLALPAAVVPLLPETTQLNDNDDF